MKRQRGNKPKETRNAPEVVDRLVTENIALAHFFAMKMQAMGADFDSSLSDAMAGLQRAAELFDETLGPKFGTYAAIWIKQKMHATWQKAQRIKWGGHAVHVCLDMQSPEGDDLSQRMADEQAHNGWDVMATADDEAILARAMASLPARELYVITHRFGLNGGRETLEEIAANQGVCRERIRQVETRALDRLRRLICEAEAHAVVSTSAQRGKVPRPQALGRGYHSPRKRRMLLEGVFRAKGRRPRRYE